MQKAQPLETRAETGPLQFGDDWPGIFIRGDNALHYADMLRLIADQHVPRGQVAEIYLRHLANVLAECDAKKAIT